MELRIKEVARAIEDRIDDRLAIGIYVVGMGMSAFRTEVEKRIGQFIHPLPELGVQDRARQAPELQESPSPGQYNVIDLRDSREPVKDDAVARAEQHLQRL